MTSVYSKRNPDPIYVGTDDGTHVVIGTAFGASLICFNASMEDALDEYDERFGERIEPNDGDLPDYLSEQEAEKVVAAGEAHTISEARMWKAIDDGDARVNSGGPVVWVDHYEWAREFKDARKAMRCFLGIEESK